MDMHPLWQHKKLRDYCSKENIHVRAWSPLGGFPNAQGSNGIMDNLVIKEIAEKHGKTTAQVHTYISC